ncbi:hypothetical protein L3V77_09490 [Vibrio sp. DW001]|uniref:hypothetical protein n=1 Tax=Vibrio sp. DW001 TaxID=2912315 RepID=UPI0023B07B8C|nr:hypothetical protein [Vibrio sp. DW001]WED25307.1 hypothetical protein L3V77_09490 [Vibrio sp. DW001]
MKSIIARNSIVVGLLFSSQVFAVPSEELIAQYNQAAQGDEAKVEVVYEQLQSDLKRNGADALSLVYLGSTQTLMGRDAFMPWNKMKHTEQGLATIAKGLDLLANDTTSFEKQPIRQGLPESILSRAVAASTFTLLPDMFNHFERGYDLYLDLLAEERFTAQPFATTSWIYFYAVKAAIRAEDTSQAERWLEEMNQRDSNNPMTLQAQAAFSEIKVSLTNVNLTKAEQAG